MTNTQQNPYEGDKIKSTRIVDIDFRPHIEGIDTKKSNQDVRIKNALINSNIIYIGDLDKCTVNKEGTKIRTHEELEIPYFGKQMISVLVRTLTKIGYRIPNETERVNLAANDFNLVSIEVDVSEQSLAVTFDLPPMLGQAIKDGDIPFASPEIDITINVNPDDITVQATKNTEAFLADISANYAETNDDATQLTINFEMAHNGTKIDIQDLTEKMATSFKRLAPK